jgi:hypothetical protein
MLVDKAPDGFVGELDHFGFRHSKSIDHKMITLKVKEKLREDDLWRRPMKDPPGKAR